MKKEAMLCVLLILFFIFLNIVVVQSEDDPFNAGDSGGKSTLPETINKDTSSTEIVDAINNGAEVSYTQITQIASHPDYDNIYNSITGSNAQSIKDKLNTERGVQTKGTPAAATIDKDSLIANGNKLPYKSGASYTFNDDGQVTGEVDDIFFSNAEGVKLDSERLFVESADEVNCAGANSQSVVNLDCGLTTRTVKVDSATVVLAEDGAVNCRNVVDSTFTLADNGLLSADVESGTDNNFCNFFSFGEIISQETPNLKVNFNQNQKFSVKYRNNYQQNKPAVSITADKGIKENFGKFKFVHKSEGTLTIVSDRTISFNNGVLAFEDTERDQQLDACEESGASIRLQG